MGGMVAVALLALILGAAYQDDNKLDEPRVVGAERSADGEATGGQVQTAGPIEGFLPKSGEASACSEDIGVDLARDYGAVLTINGVEVAAEDMNVNLTREGEISGVITASRSLGHYTFSPDDECPNGSLLRPLGNVLEVCVYRLSDASQSCVTRQTNTFDAL